MKVFLIFWFDDIYWSYRVSRDFSCTRFVSRYGYVYIHLWSLLETLPNCPGIQTCTSRWSRFLQNYRRNAISGNLSFYVTTFYRHNVRQSNPRNKLDGKQSYTLSKYEIASVLSIKDLQLAVVNRVILQWSFRRKFESSSIEQTCNCDRRYFCRMKINTKYVKESLDE